MRQEYKQPWIDALRSDKFEQGQGYLCREGKFCCLGVLMEINGISQINGIHENIKLFGNEEDYSYTKLTESFGNTVGIGTKDQRNLQVLNDGGVLDDENYTEIKTPYTFAQIADWIERNL